MARPAQPVTDVTPYCSIERALAVVSDRWSFLILRQILMYGDERFADIREHLGIASNVLTDRLDGFVEGGVLERREYRDEGERTRAGYHPTAAGLDLKLVLAALQQWGDLHEPRADGPTVRRERVSDGTPVAVSFVDGDGHALTIDEVGFAKTAAYPRDGRF